MIAEYKIEEKLGEGTYASVYKVKSNPPEKNDRMLRYPTYVCLKKYDYSFKIACQNEITLLKRMDHPNIIKYFKHKWMTSEDYVYIIMEYGGRPLDNYFMFKTLERDELNKIILQLFSAIKYIHENEIIHRDMKMGNILYDGNVKIIDFNISTITDPTYYGSFGKSFHCNFAPEMLLDLNYSTPIDIWGAGCVIYELIHKKYLFKYNSVKTLFLYNIFETLGTPNSQSWPDYQKYDNEYPSMPGSNPFIAMEPKIHNLMKQIFIYNPADRISAEKICLAWQE